MTASNSSLSGTLRVLSDETRLRILGLLGETELSVGEIARCLAMGQSRVSNHLRVLRELGWIGERHEGSFTYCHLEIPPGSAVSIWEAIASSLDSLDQVEFDRRRLTSVLAERDDGKSFFDRIAGDWDFIGSDFTHGTGRMEMISCLVPGDLSVVDVGCGTGYIGRALGRRIGHIIGVDTSQAMLDRAAENLRDVEGDVELRLGAIEQLPLDDEEVDAAFAHMVMHHLSDTRKGIVEMARVVKPGGHVVCVELLPHHETWMHESMADTRLGIEPSSIEDDFESCGLVDVTHELLSDSYVVKNNSGREIRLPLFLVRGSKKTV